MQVREALDLSHLPLEEYGSRDTLWWGVMGMILVESTIFGLLIASYFFYRMRYTQWPPGDAGLPDWNVAVPNILLMLLITWPMRRIEKEASDRSPIWLTLMLAGSALLMAVSCVLRLYEFGSLHTSWFEHSYASITWALLFAHALHLFTTCGETAMLAVYCATKPLDRKHRADIQLLSVYWYFVVISWLAVFAVIWLAGRVL